MKTILCLIYCLVVIVAKADEYPPLCASRTEQLVIWAKVLNRPIGAHYPASAEGHSLATLAAQLNPFLASLEGDVAKGDSEAALAYLATLRLRWRILEGERPTADKLMLKAIETVKARTMAGEPALGEIVVWWQERLGIAKMADPDIQSLRKKAALAGGGEALCNIVRGQNYFASQVNLSGDAEYYKFALIKFAVFTAFYGRPTGLDDMVRAARAARQTVDVEGGQAAIEATISDAETDAERRVALIDWKQLKAAWLYDIDTDRTLKQMESTK